MKTRTIIDSLAYSLRRLSKDTTGAAAIEYALLVTLIAMGLVAVLQSMGASIDGIFSFIADTMSDAAAS